MAKLAFRAERRELIKTAKQMAAEGLTDGCSGNVSARVPGGFLITPSAMAYQSLKEADIVFVPVKGKPEGKRLPSSETPFHATIYVTHPDRENIRAIVHCHSPKSMVCGAVKGLREVPAAHYSVAQSKKTAIPVTPVFDLPGADLVPQVQLAFFEGAYACILSNHGQVALGGTLAEALSLATTVEVACKVFYEASLLALARSSHVKIIRQGPMRKMVEKYKLYGKQKK